MPVELDTKGLNCPIPILKVKKAFMKMAAGEDLRVEATDPGSVIDMGIFCETKGHKILESTEQDGVYTFLIRKAP
jgi:tRNA 2-thiouridine synthesizing protein A